MTRDNFKKFLKDLGSYYGLEKIITESRFELWFEIVGHIPAESLGFVFERFTEQMDTMPRNVPKIMLGHFYQWRQASGKVIGYQQTPCSECDGYGFIWCKRLAVVAGEVLRGRDGNALYEVVSYRCPKCLNWQRHVHASAKAEAGRSEIFQRGYTVLD